MSDFAWFWISIVGVSFAISTAVIMTPQTFDNSVEMAKQGLEECVMDSGTYRTLWVKDCVAYLQFVEKGIADPNRNMVSGGKSTESTKNKIKFQ